MRIEIRVANAGEDLERCHAIRWRVFIDEQQLEQDVEFDDVDAQCRHYLVLLGDAPVATARIRRSAEEAEIERLAVLAEARGQGVGRRLMMRMVADGLRLWPSLAIIVSPQVGSAAFYASFGFKREGAAFFDHGVMRQRMRHPCALETRVSA